jgi:hypothetical protein
MPLISDIRCYQILESNGINRIYILESPPSSCRQLLNQPKALAIERYHTFIITSIHTKWKVIWLKRTTNMVGGLIVALRNKVSTSSHSISRESDYLLRNAQQVVVERYILLIQYGQDTVWIISVQLAVAIVCNTKYTTFRNWQASG